MVHITVDYKGRSFRVDLPDGADVHVRLEDDGAAPTERDVLLGGGPSARRLYRWLLGLAMGKQVVTVDPVLAERDLGLVPIALGRTLGSLEKLGHIEVVHRRKADRSKVISYKVKLKGSASLPDEASADPWDNTLEDIETAVGKRAKVLFEALCGMADVDGNILMATQRDVCLAMRPVPESFPMADFRELDRGDWIGIEEAEPLNVTIIGWSVLGPACPLRR